MSQMPANAPLSEDGQWWWDGAQWQPVPEPHAVPGVTVQHGQTPKEIEMPPDGDFNKGSYPVATDAVMSQDIVDTCLTTSWTV